MSNEKTIITLDASQMKTFMDCEQKWYYSYIENLWFYRQQSIYLDKGTFVHKLLEVYYNLRALNPKEDRFITIETVINVWKKGKFFKESGLTKDEEKFICDRFRQYGMKWMAYDFIPSKRNGVPGVELGFSKVLLQNLDFIYIVEGKIDLLSKTAHGEDCFVDNKSQEMSKNLYPFKPQFLTYAWATGFRWGIINYFRLQQKYDDAITFKRDLIYFEDWQIKKWEETMLRIFRKIHNVMYVHGIKDMNLLKPEMFEQNLNSCGGAYEKTPCAFTMICNNPGREKGIKQVYYNVRPKWSPWSNEEQEIA